MNPRFWAGSKCRRLGSGAFTTELDDLGQVAQVRINTQVSDLAPIATPKLRLLRVAQAPIATLEPLRKTTLEDFEFTPRADLSIEPLKAIETLKTINGMPAVEFFKLNN